MGVIWASEKMLYVVFFVSENKFVLVFSLSIFSLNFQFLKNNSLLLSIFHFVPAIIVVIKMFYTLYEFVSKYYINYLYILK